ncbi:zinc finger protein 395 isoform X2 [Drosophila willistoni]|uniref:zinc finger protein 395 isoform X2 n=1 Tax=Drosophila willistoni TaxID=7260 RepID=UPI000C26C705|nr:zinc finger protein 395 isoform X2 [Drosophila willistoni]
MSTGRRLAKRSIIGTKVCAPGPDGLWYSGVISDVKTPASSSSSKGLSMALAPPPTFLAPGDTQLNADTRYIVRFDFKTQQSQLSPNIVSSGNGGGGGGGGASSMSTDSVIVETRRAAAAASVHISPAQALRRNAMIKEFRETDLIGPGFRSIIGIQLQHGQRVFLTYNGREQSGDVVHHDASKDEVVVKITTTGIEEPIELKKRLDEVRLLESRRSARLADQDRDTDFARLADMGGDRRRTTHSIEVPLTPQHNSRKRPPSDTHECGNDQCDKDEMNECHAALILMNLHNSPHGVGDKWLASSPGSSSSASWSSGSASPPLSDDGHAHHSHHILSPHDAANARIRTTSVSTSDEGIVSDFKEERKKKSKKFRCTWKGCHFVEHTQAKIEVHIRNKHLGKKARRSGDCDSCSENEHEEEFYYTEDDDDDELVKTTPSLAPEPTLSHRDMARPPTEDPEYQNQIVGNFKQGRALHLSHQQQQLPLHHNNINTNSSRGAPHIISSHQQHQLQNNNTSCIPTSPLAHRTHQWSSSGSAITVTASSTLNKHPRQSSSRPSHSVAPYPPQTYVQHHNHHNYAGSGGSGSGSSSISGSNSSSPIIHSNSSANNMLQQLSQQNVTVTAHHSQQQHSNNHHHQQQQQQQQQQQHLSSVTITANYQPTQQQQQQPHHNQHQHQHQHHVRGQQHTTTASNLVANTNNNSNANASNISLQHVAVQQAVAKHTPNSPNRRTRGENKKCRKVYGMEQRDKWCTQCRWKKACSRFGD